MSSGIYKIQSQIHPERCYIGSAQNIKRRWDHHLCDLRKNRHHSLKMQNHYNKYGESDLVFIIIEPCLPQFLTIREDVYLGPLPYFNIQSKAGSSLGTRWPEERRMKLIGNTNASGKRSEETKINIRQSQLGNHKTLGKHWKQSEEVCKKKSERMKGINTWSKGCHYSEEAKKKLRGNKNASGKRSEETKKTMRESTLMRFANKESA